MQKKRKKQINKTKLDGMALTDSEEIFIKSSGPGVPTSIIISFN